MSRIGNKTITIPAGIEVTISPANEVAVKGPKGTLARQFSPLIGITNEDGVITCTRENEQKHTKQLHGTTRALINNMIIGVNEGYFKTLKIVGIGYKAAINGNKLTLNVGYSHTVEFVAEEGITIECPTVTDIKVSGIDKQRVGEIAAQIRATRKPEPYKGKGIRYTDEHIRRKEGKTAGKK
jgi:large subunit ribosomal protein L6